MAFFLLVGDPGQGAAAEKKAAPANYRLFPGEQFFLLSDSSFGSDSVSAVRIEAPGRRYGYLEQYSGVDILVYRVPEPLPFLKTHKNLHRVEVRGRYAGEGLANTLRYLWDNWNQKARYAWQRLFSQEARQTVTKEAPELKTPRSIGKPTEFEHNPQFAPLPGFELVDRFRYPLWQAKPIEPPKDLKLSGSSSSFMPISPGNVMVPLGKRKPGLYLVEAVIGGYRANTLLFVSDTVALVKNASDQLVVWTADRHTGQAVGQVQVAWTDGLGTLQSGKTGADGTVVFGRNSPEHTYVVGQDGAGGVFVSENFYYDSEIYNAKILAFTDRPLYRPGDTVHVKFVGREFKDARRSLPLAAGDMPVTILDPNGTPVRAQALKVSPEWGAATSFDLPENSVPGGYDLRFEYQGNMYGSAFRVAEYTKPHYEINVVLSKPEFKTGEPITGKILLAYPDGKPVQGATLQMTVKEQKLTMVESELQYYGQFPVKLATEELAVDNSGTVSFALPAAADPSRYILTLFAQDQAAYRVKTTKEILIERGATLYTLTAPLHFTSPGEEVTFSSQAQGSGGRPPRQWEIVHLETQRKTSGRLEADSSKWTVRFTEAGSYTLMLRDDRGNMLGATSHWVAGEGLKAVPGSIEIVFDKEKYKPGETARALITFPEPVQEALLTLERDRVDSHALLSRGGSWLRAMKIGNKQWRAEIPVREEYAPNMTFSVLYSLRGDYVFQNRGLKVQQESIALRFKTDKEVYQPGERVSVEVTSSIGGQPAEVNLAVSVVDEMVYVLQPEIAPDIFDFFYHPRRNNVRTSSSLSFISYDMARSALPSPPSRSNVSQRALKVLDRPRRDNLDTAAWFPDLKTDRNGKATFVFTMPDALTRWRITGRAMASNGIVGQKTASVQSFKPLYLTWTGPTRFRQGDAPVIDLVAFNQTERETKADFSASGSGLSVMRKLDLKPGPNYLSLPVAQAQEGLVTLTLSQDGRTVDALSTLLRVSPVHWVSPRSEMLTVTGASTPLPLPPDASRVRIGFLRGEAAHFSRIVDDLIDYPWGCVEQTASRLIPLSLAYQTMSGEPGVIAQGMARSLQTNRLRLVHMAGPDAAFGWWGNMTANSALWTAYAYYADWHASRALSLTLPPDHWSHVLSAYRKHANREPFLHRVLTLWFAKEMGLPIKTMLQGLQDQVKDISAISAFPLRIGTSPLLVAPDLKLGQQMAVVLIAQMAAQQQQEVKPGLAAQVAAARSALHSSGLPLAQALLLMEAKTGRESQAAEILSQVRQEMPTFDRALTLVWVQKALGATPSGKPVDVKLQGDWRSTISGAGNRIWHFSGPEGGSTRLDLSEEPKQPVTAVIRYESSEEERSQLPVRIERRLYRLKGGGKGLLFEAARLADHTAVSSKELYVEEIRLATEGGQTFRYGVLEVPLPPGADVERTTWGMQVRGFGGSQPHPMEKARHEMGQLSYSIPVDRLSGSITIRHLIRFSQKGEFNLPPARFFRMYQPEQKALEGGGETRRGVRVR